MSSYIVQGIRFTHSEENDPPFVAISPSYGLVARYSTEDAALLAIKAGIRFTKGKPYELTYGHIIKDAKVYRKEVSKEGTTTKWVEVKEEQCKPHSVSRGRNTALPFKDRVQE